MSNTQYNAKIRISDSLIDGFIVLINGTLKILDNNNKQIGLWDEYCIHVFIKDSTLCIQNTTDKSIIIELNKSLGLIQAIETEFDIKLGSKKVSNSISSDLLKYIKYTFALGLFCFVLMWGVRSLSVHFLIFYPDSEDYIVGEKYFEKYLKKSLLKNDSPPSTELDKILKVLTNKVNTLPHHLKVYVSPSKDVNAYALPGGIIVFNRGLIDQAKSKEELLGVFAHEIGHVVLRHGMKRLVSDKVVSWFSLLVSDTNVLGLNLDHLTSLRYSREQEVEADKYALRLLNDNKISVRGIHDFFNRKKNGNYKIDWLSTHPVDKDRLHKIEVHLNPNLENDSDLSVLRKSFK